ncbi:hypothetical protein ApAK_07610 [Thermoplasmatales archaeon AK]|nr:hypothetical protein [Thermoplasmatales archaeon AK]
MAKLATEVKKKALEIAVQLGVELGGCTRSHEDIKEVPKTFFELDNEIWEQVSVGFAVYEKSQGTFRIENHYHTGRFVRSTEDKRKLQEMIYVPYKDKPLKYGQITLSDSPVECTSLMDIIREIETKAERWLYIGAEEVPIFRVQLRIAVASWFLFVYDDINIPERVAGLLSIVGTSGGVKKRWLTLMRQIAYRPIFLLNTTKIPSVYRMAEPWGNPTLLIDEADQKETGSEAEQVQFINSRYDGTPIPRFNTSTGKTDVFRSFGLTGLALRRMPKDEGMTSRMTKINATISPVAIDEVAGPEMVEDFREIRNKLLYLRLKWYGRLKFVGRSGLPAEQSWRGKETLTLFRVLEQIDPAISQDIEEISKALTEREVQNLSQTWDGLIANEIYAFIVGDNTAYVEKNKALYFTSTWIDRDGKEHTSYLNLKYVADRLGASASEIQRSIVQFKITTYDRFRPVGSKKAQRGILMFRYLADTDRIFQRYVPGYQHELLKYSISAKLDDFPGGDSVPPVPVVPPHDVSDVFSDPEHDIDIHVASTSGTAGTNDIEPKSSDEISNTLIPHEEKHTPSGTVSEGQISIPLNIQSRENKENSQFSKINRDLANIYAHFQYLPWKDNPKKALFEFVYEEAQNTKYRSMNPKTIYDMVRVLAPDLSLSKVRRICEELYKKGAFLKNTAGGYHVNNEYLNGGDFE